MVALAIIAVTVFLAAPFDASAKIHIYHTHQAMALTGEIGAGMVGDTGFEPVTPCV